MASLDISKNGNVIQIKVGNNNPTAFSNSKANWKFNPDNVSFVLYIDLHSFTCLLSELTVSGVAPANVAASYTALGSLFPA